MTVVHNLDKSKMKKDLANILDKYSSKELSELEIKNLYNRDKNVKYYLSLLETFKQASASNEDKFMSSIIEFMGNALVNEEDELHQILLVYLLLIASYITDFFNTDGLKDKKKHIKKLKKLFYDSTLNIITTYESELLKTIKKVQYTK